MGLYNFFMKKHSTNNRDFLRIAGFTLIEIMIGLMVSSLLIIGLTRLYSTMLSSYSLQEQLTEMNQNAKFTIKEISDVLMQAGADCAAINSDTLDKDTIITPDAVPCHGFTIKVNPRGGLYVVLSRIPAAGTMDTRVVCSLTVDDVSKFKPSIANWLEKIPLQNLSNPRKIAIYKLDSIHTTTNRVYFSSGIAVDSFCVNDAVFSFKNNHYGLSGTTLCLNNDTLAENIDSLTILFYNNQGNQLDLSATPTLWARVWSITITVEATTSLPDNRYIDKEHGDHWRRLKLSYQFRLKNKV